MRYYNIIFISGRHGQTVFRRRRRRRHGRVYSTRQVCQAEQHRTHAEYNGIKKPEQFDINCSVFEMKKTDDSIQNGCNITT